MWHANSCVWHAKYCMLQDFLLQDVRNFMAASKKINWHAIFMYLARQVLSARQRVSASSWAFTDTRAKSPQILNSMGNFVWKSIISGNEMMETYSHDRFLLFGPIVIGRLKGSFREQLGRFKAFIFLCETLGNRQMPGGKLFTNISGKIGAIKYLLFLRLPTLKDFFSTPQLFFLGIFFTWNRIRLIFFSFLAFRFPPPPPQNLGWNFFYSPD